MKKKKTDYIDKIADIGTGKLSKKEEKEHDRETERLSKEQGWKEAKKLKKTLALFFSYFS